MPLKVKVEFSRGVKTRPGGVAAVVGRAHVGIARTLAKQILKRVAMQGKPVDRAPNYSDNEKRPKLISPRYPARGANKTGKSGALVYDSSRAFHAAMGTRQGTYNVSGGMWAGLTTLVTPRGTFIKFRGRSEGQGMASKTLGKGQRTSEPHFRRMANGKVKARPRKVSNALKAATVLRSHGVHVLKPTDAEIQAMGLAATEVAWTAMPSVGTAKVKWDRGSVATTPLARKMAAAVRRNRKAA